MTSVVASPKSTLGLKRHDQNGADYTFSAKVETFEKGRNDWSLPDISNLYLDPTIMTEKPKRHVSAPLPSFSRTSEETIRHSSLTAIDDDERMSSNLYPSIAENDLFQMTPYNTDLSSTTSKNRSDAKSNGTLKGNIDNLSNQTNTDSLAESCPSRSITPEGQCHGRKLKPNEIHDGFSDRLDDLSRENECGASEFTQSLKEYHNDDVAASGILPDDISFYEESLLESYNNYSMERPQIEISPGQYMPLRGSEETWYAIQSGECSSACCTVCNLKLLCISDADLVLCPDCRVLSPLNADRVQLFSDQSGDRKVSRFSFSSPCKVSSPPVGGVGLGVKENEVRWITGRL
uniref:Uncharacterized protein n=1 Tax=Ditylum brightwellii TaxID=49249 RepID=A0A7S4VHB8_9STRA